MCEQLWNIVMYARFVLCNLSVTTVSFGVKTETLRNAYTGKQISKNWYCDPRQPREHKVQC